MRLDIRVNSTRVCVAGIDASDQGVLDARVSIVTKTPSGDKCDLFVSSKQIAGGDLTFGLVTLTEGDEIVIRVLPAGEFDAPEPLVYVDPAVAQSTADEYAELLEAYQQAERMYANKERQCPRCNSTFVSVQNRGQCPNCRLIFLASHPMGDEPWQ